MNSQVSDLENGYPLPERKPTWFRALGLLPLLFYLLHPFRVYVIGGSPAEGLWFCHVSNLVLGFGILFALPRIVSLATSWLLLGTSLWVIDLAAGGEFIPSSLLVHVFGAMLSIYATSKFGFPKNTWLLATISMLALQLITRLITPEEPNVNLAFRVWSGWEHIFTSYILYMVILYTVGIAAFFGIELAFRRFLHQ